MKEFFRLKMSPGYEAALIIAPAAVGMIMATGALTMADYAGDAAFPLFLTGCAVVCGGSWAAVGLISLLENLNTEKA